MPLDWSQPLTRTLALKSGAKLRTLHDVAEAFLRRFGNVRPDRAVAHAIELMMRAAETGTAADGKAATDQAALVLRLNGATPPPYVPGQRTPATTAARNR